MSMPNYAMTYVVYWPEHGVLKVGRAWRFSRVQMMTMSGGRVLVLARGTDATWEREALRQLRAWFPAAFRNEDDARDLLFMGRGWTECFKVDGHHLPLAVDLCFEGFAKGSDQGVNEATEDRRERPGLPGLSEGAARGEADSARTVDEVDGRVGASGVRSGVDRGGAVSGRGGDADGRGASADAGRVGVPDPVPGRRGGLDSATAAVACGHSGRAGRLPTAPTWTYADVRGCGGSAGAGGGAGAWAGGRACGGVGRVGAGAGAHRTRTRPPAADAGTSDRMPRAPGWPVRGLRSLRYGTPPARPLGAAGAPHTPDDRVRAGE